MSQTIVLIFVLALLCVSEAALYTAQRVSTTTTSTSVRLATISTTTGALTYLNSSTIVVPGGSLQLNTVAFNEPNQTYSFVNGQKIYGVNVLSGKAQTTYTISALSQIRAIHWSTSNNKFMVYGQLPNTSVVVYAYNPVTLSGSVLVNLDNRGIPLYLPQRLAMDASGNGYFVYAQNPKAGTLRLLKFTQTGATTDIAVSCTIPMLSLGRLFYDTGRAKLIGVGVSNTTTGNMVFFQVTPSSGACTKNEFNGGKYIAEVAYNQALSMIYVYGSFSGSNSKVYQHNITSSSTTSTSVNVPPTVFNIAASTK